MARKIGAVESPRVEVLYEKIRAKELTLAMSPDPRLLLGDLPPHERAVLESQKYSPTVLGQVDALMHHQPVRFPRWWLGGPTVPEACGWEPFDSRRYDWFILSPDDTLRPA